MDTKEQLDEELKRIKRYRKEIGTRQYAYTKQEVNTLYWRYLSKKAKFIMNKVKTKVKKLIPTINSYPEITECPVCKGRTKSIKVGNGYICASCKGIKVEDLKNEEK